MHARRAVCRCLTLLGLSTLACTASTPSSPNDSSSPPSFNNYRFTFTATAGGTILEVLAAQAEIATKDFGNELGLLITGVNGWSPTRGMRIDLNGNWFGHAAASIPVRQGDEIGCFEEGLIISLTRNFLTRRGQAI